MLFCFCENPAFGNGGGGDVNESEGIDISINGCVSSIRACVF